MAETNENRNTWGAWGWGIVFVISCTIICVVIGFISSNKIEFIDWLAVIFGYASLFSLVVVLVQFQSVRATTEKTRQEIKKITSITEWSKYAETARSLKDDILRDAYSVAVFKLHLIKHALISVPNSLLSQDSSLNKLHGECLKAINGHISSLDAKILNDASFIAKNLIMQDMVKTSDFFYKIVNSKIN